MPSGIAAAAKPLQSCPTLCDRIGSSPPGSPIPEILQGRTLEWGAIAFSASRTGTVLLEQKVLNQSVVARVQDR